MKSRIAAASATLFGLLLFLQPAFGDDFFNRNSTRAGFVAQVGIGGDAYYGAHWSNCGYYKRDYCRKHRGWRHHYRDDRYYRY